LRGRRSAVLQQSRRPLPLPIFGVYSAMSFAASHFGKP
jgi:hypothetical protein